MAHTARPLSWLPAACLWALGATFFSVSAMQVALGLALLIWLGAGWRGQLGSLRELPGRSFLVPGAVWALAGLVSIAAATDQGRSLGELGDLVWVLVPLVFAAGLGTGAGLRRAEQVLIGAALLSAAIGLAQVAANGFAFRAYGTLGQYMTFAGTLLITAQLLLAGVLFGRPSARWVRALVLMPILAALFVTHTRSAWLGFGVGGWLLLVLRSPRWILAPLPVIALLLAFGPEPLRERAFSFFDAADRTANERVYMWQAGLELTGDHLWTGVGPKNVEAELPAYRLPDDPWLPWRRLAHLHNNPVHVLAERGVLGLLAYLLLIGWPLVLAWRCWRRLRGPDLRALAVGSFAGQVAFHVAGCFEYSFGDAEVVTLYWWLAALPLVLGERGEAAEAELARPAPPIAWTRIAVMAALVLALGEVWARSQTKADGEGNQRIGSKQLYPRALPQQRVQRALDQLGTPGSYLVYDEVLGWTVAPEATGPAGLAHSDAHGRRVVPQGSSAAPGALRIAVFGAERTHGVGVGDGETWPAQLAHSLAQAGQAVELRNYAVPGYGQGQMWLRFQAARDFQPDVVLVGVSGERNERAMNRYPVLLEADAVWPFAKPRFEVVEHRLVLRGSPVPAPQHVPELLEGLAAGSLDPLEVFFAADSLQSPPLGGSRLASYLWTCIAPLEEPDAARFYATDGAALSARLLRALAEEASGDGARVLGVHLPTPGRGGQRLYDLFASRLEKITSWEWVQPELQTGESRAYGPKDNKAVAEALSLHLRAR